MKADGRKVHRAYILVGIYFARVHVFVGTLSSLVVIVKAAITTLKLFHVTI